MDRVSEAATPEAIDLLRGLQWSGRSADGAPACPICHDAEASGHAPGCALARCLGAETAPLWRHRKRGTAYREIGVAALQTSGGSLRDQDRMMVYRAEADGTLGVRALLEFTDGRFERLDP